MAASSSCNLTEATVSAIRNLYITTNVASPPVYLLLGSALNVAAFLFFKLQLKRNEAYGYQIAASAFKLLEMVSVSVMFLCLCLAGWGPVPGWAPFRASYGCMWYTCKISYATAGVAVNQFIIFPSAIAVDRAFAMLNPVRYKTIAHTRHQIVASALCWLISIAIGVDMAFDFDVISGNDGGYTLGYSAANANVWKRVFVQGRNAVRYASVGVTIVATAVFVYKFRKRNKVAAGRRADGKREEEAKADERAILVLSFVQCSVVCVYVALSTAVMQARTYFPLFYMCRGGLLQYTFSGCTQLAGIADYVILFMYNKKFRLMLAKKLKSLRAAPKSTSVRSIRNG